MVAEALPNQALESAAIHRTGRGALGNGEPQSCGFATTMADKDREMAIAMTTGIGEHGPEVPGLGQARSPGKTLSVRRRPSQGQGVSRARPLARRRASTLRPLRVAIRARKP